MDYAPDKFYTDHSYKSIILHYEGRTDTVSVYHLPLATVPRSLRNLIEYLDELQTEIIETYGKTVRCDNSVYDYRATRGFRIL